MTLRWQHHVIEILREHRRCEKSDRAQRFVSDIYEVVFYGCRQDKDAARTNLVHRTIFHVQFAGAGDDVLRFFGRISVPAEPLTGLNLVHDRAQRCRAMSAIDCKCAAPVNRLVVFCPDFSAFQFIGCDNGIHAPTLGFDCGWVNAAKASALCPPARLPLQQSFGEQLGHVFWPETR